MKDVKTADYADMDFAPKDEKIDPKAPPVNVGKCIVIVDKVIDDDTKERPSEAVIIKEE